MSSNSSWFRKQYERLQTFSSTTTGKRVFKIIEHLINVSVLGWLVYELSNVGWEKIWNALPTQWEFYAIFLIIFFTLPFSEVFVYRISWPVDRMKSFWPLVKKRIYNKSFMGYSGEVYLFYWLKKRINISKREVFEVIRDNNILSSVGSGVFAISVMLIYLATGQQIRFEQIGVDFNLVIYISIAVLLIFLLLPKRIRGKLYSMNARDSIKIFGLHFGRLLALAVFQILQWSVVLTEVPVETWLTLTAVQVVINRLPVVPNRDILFVAAGIKLASGMNLPSDALAGLLLTATALDKIMSLLMFSAITYFDETSDEKELDEAAKV